MTSILISIFVSLIVIFSVNKYLDMRFKIEKNEIEIEHIKRIMNINSFGKNPNSTNIPFGEIEDKFGDIEDMKKWRNKI